MEWGTLIYQFIFMPLQLLFEEIYYLIGYKLTKDPGLSIIVLSLTVNLLVLPLYNRADAVQEAEREIDAKLRRGVEHIKKTFKGDKQLLLLQTYYKQNDYSPLDVVKGSISLFLEIPFFVAAYQFLSHLPILQGAALGPIQNLGAPDALLTLGGMSINLLPLLMTLVNLAATGLFVTGMPTKTKLQLYGLAFFFLVFLYHSPSGLVFYWTLNNLFNLGKTIVYKLWKPAVDLEGSSAKADSRLFFTGAAFMGLLTGLLIPSSVISASPQEFIVAKYLDNPMWYLASSFAMGMGAFVLWLGVFYWLATLKGKLRYEKFITGFCITGICTYMLWGSNNGLLSSTLVLSNGLSSSYLERGLNIGLLLFVCVGIYFLWHKYHRHLSEVLALGCIAMLGMSVLNIHSIRQSLQSLESGRQVAKQAMVSEDSQKLVLSREGRNVVLIMLDRAMGAYVPYMLQEKPELKQLLDGFTYYGNTISFGGHTLFGAPPIFGGYEYTPEVMNKRSDVLLREKHNEAMLLLPVLFSRAGYKATVSDLPLVNYQWIPDYTPFKDYPQIRIESFGKSTQIPVKEEELLETVAKNKRNFFCYGLMKSVPLLLQVSLYGNGHYNRFSLDVGQRLKGPLKSTGSDKAFLEQHGALEELAEKTKIVSSGNTFISMVNDITHDGQLLQLPDYKVQEQVDNTAFFHSDSYIIAGRRLAMNNGRRVADYHVNMAALLRLGDWFTYLRQQGVYDNTRIILVSDHGSATGQLQALNFAKRIGKLEGKRLNKGDALAYFPLLLVKDFDSKGFSMSDSFMTTADVPVLAVQGLLDKPCNPFTGNALTNAAKQGKEQFIIETNEYEFRYNQGNTYPKARWYAIKDSIWNGQNWRLAGENTTLPR